MPNFPTQVGSFDRETYRTVKVIGSGGESNCYLLEHRSTKQLVVFKKVRDAFCDPDGIPREIAALYGPIPPSKRIVNLLGFKLGSTTEIYLEYYSGGDLQGLIHAFYTRRAHIPEAFIWQSLYHLSNALMLLHDGVNQDRTTPSAQWRRVLHRDVKPANVLLRKSDAGLNPALVLADFGMAGFRTASGGRGTLTWQPPEFPYQCTKCDIWAVGAIVHALGHAADEDGAAPVREKPHGVKTINFIMDPGSRRVRPLCGRHYSVELQRAMAHAMRTDPNERASARDLMGYCLEMRRSGKLREDRLPDWIFENAIRP